MKPDGRLTVTFYMILYQCADHQLQSPASVVLTGTKCLQPVEAKFGRSAL